VHWRLAGIVEIKSAIERRSKSRVLKQMADVLTAMGDQHGLREHGAMTDTNQTPIKGWTRMRALLCRLSA